MAFRPDTKDLWLEVRAALEQTSQHAAYADAMLRRLTGRWWRKDQHDQEAEPENFGYSYLSNMLPKLAVANPGVSVQAARVIGHETIAQAMEDGSEAWVNDVNYYRAVEPTHVDFLRLRGVLMHHLEEDARFSRGSVTPAVRRIAPERFFQDALAEDANTDAFRGHWYHVDIDDLKADPNVNQEVLARVAPGNDDIPDGEGRIGGGGGRKPDAASLGRRRVKCYSVWLRDSNTIRVLVEGAEEGELYPPRPYYGSPDGPYELFDAYPIPGSCWPLAPLVAIQDQALDLNIHARALGRAAARRKSIGLVEANNPDLGAKLANAKDGEIVPARGITGNHVILELGGGTKEQYTYSAYARDRLERISGMTATVQGSVGDADTATEAQIASNALNDRIDYLRRKVLAATEESLKKIGWYLFHTEGIVIPVNRRDAYSGERVEGLFFGGPDSTDHGASWDDFDLTIKINTMQREVAHRDNVLAFYQYFSQIAGMAPQMPWVRWMNVVRDLGDAFNLGDKADEWFIPELFGAFGQPPQFPVSQVIGAPESGGPGGYAHGGSNMGWPAVRQPNPGNPPARGTGGQGQRGKAVAGVGGGFGIGGGGGIGGVGGLAA